MLYRKCGELKHLKWSLVKMIDDPVPGTPANWRVDEIIHPRFMLMWATSDPTVKEQTGYKLELWKDGPCLWAYRLQIVRFWAQFRMWRRPLWDPKGRLWDFPMSKGQYKQHFWAFRKKDREALSQYKETIT